MSGEHVLGVRERDARAAGLAGIESVTVDEGRTRLAVSLFGPVPEELVPANFRIDGGVVARDLRVVSVETDPGRGDDAEGEPPGRVLLRVDRPGDVSAYRLSVVRTDAFGRPGTEPPEGFDPFFASAGFTFGQDCPATVDCRPDPCPPGVFPEPVIDYLAKDYAGLRRALLERLALTLPAWGERHAADMTVALVELLAYAGDQLSYEQDAVAAEAYLDTARLRTSVRRHVRLVDYPMHDGCAARAFVCLSCDARTTLPAGTFRFRAGGQVFEPVRAEPVTVRPAHGRIGLWSWGEHEYSLPAGTTSAALRDGEGEHRLSLRAGDVVVFEEVLGAATGLPADADRGHRQAVRLVAVRRGVDRLYGQRLLEVEWDAEDALAFPLRVRAVGGPRCVPLDVAVARGNTVLVEHGASRTWCGAQPERVTRPARPPGAAGCPCPPESGCADPGGPAALPAYPPTEDRFEPRVPGDGAAAPVTWSVPFPLPPDIARAQARRLDGIPGRARERLLDLLRSAEGGHRPDGAALAWLTTVFGAAALRRPPLATEPVAALRTLVARFEELLERKLARLRELARRARAGYVLRAADEGWEIGQGWGAAEGGALDPELPVFHGPAARALAPDPRAALPVVEVRSDDGGDSGDDSGEGAAGPAWLPRRDLLDCGPADRCFVGELDDDGVLVLRFGDGHHGAVPAPGSALALRYRLGNGTAGNVGAEAIDTVELCGVTGVTVRVRNPLPATGGADPEPLAEVRRRAPGEALRRLLRAVTEADYAALAGEVPGVQGAGARLRWTGSWYEAQVAVDALGTDVAPEALLDGVRERLHRVRRIGHEVRVGPARQVPLRLALCVEAEPSAVAGHVRAALARVLGHGRTADGAPAFFHPDALTFGTPVRVSRIVAVAAAVPGVLSVSVTALERLFEPSPDALREGVLPLGPDEIARLDGDPARPGNGVLELRIGGGR
ncbi:putative baseplate assembly protein [Streptomyces sp. NPDC059104]|uniref:putative baseplate assembly protein n=1 Tax=Streptomyces sp. NPDC059104 TaxID=3346729 RepID=UPI00368BB34D